MKTAMARFISYSFLSRFDSLMRWSTGILVRRLDQYQTMESQIMVDNLKRLQSEVDKALDAAEATHGQK